MNGIVIMEMIMISAQVFIYLLMFQKIIWQFILVTCRRFVVRIRDLNHPLFRMLLDKAEEEFGFEQRGFLVIPCDPKVVQHLLSLVQTKAPPLSVSFYGESSCKRVR
ncbi:hypothetical protein SUGI_0200690 [Cryptomeria japonica]|nr:hypothetical protein SUGI_0200690 [Cryptomeria japonica]